MLMELVSTSPDEPANEARKEVKDQDLTTVCYDEFQ